MSQSVDADFVRGFVKQWADLVSAHDVDGLLKLATDDIVFVDAAFPEPFHGKDAFRSILAAIFGAFPDLRYDPVGEPLLSLDRTVAATRVHFTGTMRDRLDPPGFSPTDSPIDFHGVERFEFTDGKVRRVELLFNVMELGVQIGAVPAPGSGGEKVGLLLQRIQARVARRRARLRSRTASDGA